MNKGLLGSPRKDQVGGRRDGVIRETKKDRKEWVEEAGTVRAAHPQRRSGGGRLCVVVSIV